MSRDAQAEPPIWAVTYARPFRMLMCPVSMVANVTHLHGRQPKRCESMKREQCRHECKSATAARKGHQARTD